MKYELKEGTRVLAPDNDGIVREGVIVDNLSVMCYIRFTNGDEAFCYKADKNLRETP